MTTTTTPTVVRHGPALPIVAAVLGVLAVPLSWFLTIVSWPVIVGSIVCGAIALRRRDRMWGFGLAAIILAVFSVVMMLLVPLLLYSLLSFGFGAEEDPWSGYWAFCWDLWTQPFSG